MNIGIVKDMFLPEDSIALGGEYATCDLIVHVDSSLPPRSQRLVVIHSILENYLQSWHHDKIDELTALIESGLDELESDIEL